MENMYMNNQQIMNAQNSQQLVRRCYFHANEPAVAQCAKCGKSVCKDCADSYRVISGEFANRVLCYDCCSQIVSVNVNMLNQNKKKIWISIVLMAIGALIGMAYSLSIDDPVMMVFFVPLGAVFFNFVKDFFRSIGQSFRVIGETGNELVGIIFFIFKLMYLFFKCIVVAVIKLIQNIIYLVKTSHAAESDSECLRQMQDYMQYTQVIHNNQGQSIENMVANDNTLLNNIFIKEYMNTGRNSAESTIKSATSTIIENNELINSYKQ